MPLTAELTEGTRVVITTDRHTWFADEPVPLGGSDAGPTPYEMLLGSLAACTAITLRLYANHKGIPLVGVRAEYDFGRIHVEDCADCEETDRGMIERVTARVTLIGSFDEAQRRRLEQIVGRCPVHKTLTNGVRIADNVLFVEADPPPIL